MDKTLQTSDNSPWIKFSRLGKMFQTKIKNNETNIFTFYHQNISRFALHT